MTANGSGQDLDRRADFAAFDSLPKAVRDELNSAGVNFSAVPLAERHAKGKLENNLLQTIRPQNRKATAIDTWVMYGPAHPAAATRVTDFLLRTWGFVPGAIDRWWAA